MGLGVPWVQIRYSGFQYHHLFPDRNVSSPLNQINVVHIYCANIMFAKNNRINLNTFLHSCCIVSVFFLSLKRLFRKYRCRDNAAARHHLSWSCSFHFLKVRMKNLLFQLFTWILWLNWAVRQWMRLLRLQSVSGWSTRIVQGSAEDTSWPFMPRELYFFV